jgi:hypothetical protein
VDVAPIGIDYYADEVFRSPEGAKKIHEEKEDH